MSTNGTERHLTRLFDEHRRSDSVEADVPFASPVSTKKSGLKGSDGVAECGIGFFAEVARLQLLTREEEAELAGAIVVRRDRVLRLLRRRSRLVAGALGEAGRGVVHPDEDFREREALMVLQYARRSLSRMDAGRRGRKTLAVFVADLDRQLSAYRDLRDRMITANIRLVMALTRRYHHPTLSFLDLVQEGVLGLVRAVEKYEPCRGIKFSTYAVWWIWQQISRAADCQGAMIRTPVHWNQFRRKLGRDDRDPVARRDASVVAQKYGMSAQRVRAMSQAFPCISLASPVGDDEGRTLADLLPADLGVGPEGAMLGADMSSRLCGAVEELPEREAEILRLRFGLEGATACTLEEIGDRFGVSRERIRQLEARALKLMRGICEEQGLHELLH